MINIYFKHLLLSIILLSSLCTFAQSNYAESSNNMSLEKGIIVKANILSFAAQKPTASIEKLLPNQFSIEFSYVQGQFNNFFFTDHYDYSGVLLRLKKYQHHFQTGDFNPFWGTYLGNLSRNIHTQGRTDNTGLWSYPSRNFSANSIRAGGTIGIGYFTKSKFVFEGLTSLGYGQYLSSNKFGAVDYSNGYLDFQLWLSVGFRF